MVARHVHSSYTANMFSRSTELWTRSGWQSLQGVGGDIMFAQYFNGPLEMTSRWQRRTGTTSAGCVIESQRFQRIACTWDARIVHTFAQGPQLLSPARYFKERLGSMREDTRYRAQLRLRRVLDVATPDPLEAHSFLLDLTVALPTNKIILDRNIFVDAQLLGSSLPAVTKALRPLLRFDDVFRCPTGIGERAFLAYAAKPGKMPFRGRHGNPGVVDVVNDLWDAVGDLPIPKELLGQWQYLLALAGRDCCVAGGFVAFPKSNASEMVTKVPEPLKIKRPQIIITPRPGFILTRYDRGAPVWLPTLGEDNA